MKDKRQEEKAAKQTQIAEAICPLCTRRDALPANPTVQDLREVLGVFAQEIGRHHDMKWSDDIRAFAVTANILRTELRNIPDVNLPRTFGRVFSRFETAYIELLSKLV